MEKLLLKDLYFNDPATMSGVQVKMQILYLCCHLELLKRFKTEMEVDPVIATKLLADNEALLYNHTDQIPPTTQKQYSLCNLIRIITVHRIQLMQEYLLPLNGTPDKNTQWELYEHLSTKKFADEVAAECVVEVLKIICAEGVAFAKHKPSLKLFNDFCTTMWNHLNEKKIPAVPLNLVNDAAKQIIALADDIPVGDLETAISIKGGDYNPMELLAAYFHVFEYYQFQNSMIDARDFVVKEKTSPLSLLQYKITMQQMNIFTNM